MPQLEYLYAGEVYDFVKAQIACILIPTNGPCINRHNMDIQEGTIRGHSSRGIFITLDRGPQTLNCIAQLHHRRQNTFRALRMYGTHPTSDGIWPPLCARKRATLILCVVHLLRNFSTVNCKQRRVKYEM